MGVVGRRSQGAPAEAEVVALPAAPVSAEPTTLLELTQGPYLVIAMQLDVATLCRADGTCRLLRALNRANVGPWRASGVRAFYGLELEHDGVFEVAERDDDGKDSPTAGGRKHARVDWKGRYCRFRAEAPTFQAPFAGMEITGVKNPDEVAYSRCRLRTDLLDTSSERGMYLEIQVLSNADNLSLAVVDFEAGGRSSVTFSPDTGAVIRERKVRESPRKVEGAYIQPLSTLAAGRRFEGSLGLHIHAGHLAFFRRCARSGASEEEESWESTGFVSDFSWAEGRRLTPCLAFRNEGVYRVRLVKLSPMPPHMPTRTAMAYDDKNWNWLDWEAGEAG